jgi:hypothetical protein
MTLITHKTSQTFHIQSLAQKKYSKKKPILKTQNLHEIKSSPKNNKIDWSKATDILKNGIGDAVGDELGELFGNTIGNAVGDDISKLFGDAIGDATGDIIGDNIEIDNPNHTSTLLSLMPILFIVRRFIGNHRV